MDCQERCGRVSLVQYPKTHPFAQLTGSDNIIAFTTARYSKQPLIIRCAPLHVSADSRAASQAVPQTY